MDRYTKRLFHKYLRRECTPQEAKTVLKWIQDNPDSPELQKLMEKQWDEVVTGKAGVGRYESDWESLQSKIKGSQNKKSVSGRNTVWFIKIAATLTLFITVGWWAATTIDWTPKQARDQTPSTVSIVKSAEKGEKRTFFLPDGTKITLNSGSRLTAEPAYGKSERRVSLEGETYFEVAEDPESPFLVSTGPLVTRALGTSFNIRYNKEKEDIAVSLTSGKVSVAVKEETAAGPMKEILEPGEEAVFKTEKKKLETTVFDVRKVTAWKDGIMILDDADVYEVKETLENWYAVEINLLNMPGEDWKFSGEFRNEALTNVLKGLNYSKDIEYVINENKVFISFENTDR